MKKEKWEQGLGGFIGFTVCIVLLFSILMLLIHFFVYFRDIQEADQALSYISREIAVCESLDEANKKAEELIDTYFHGSGTMPKEKMMIKVDYAPGSDTEWEKGNYVVVILSVRIENTDPFSRGIRETSNMVMIERDGK